MKKDSAKDIKIAFFDVDGTLVDMEKKVITPAMIETLKHLKENGIILCMATGRGPYLVPSFPGIDLMSFYLIMRLIVIQRMRLFFQILSQKKM